MRTVSPDEFDADWTKKSWDFPPYKSKEFFAQLICSLDDFKKMSAYRYAVEAGLIHDDEWVGDSVEGWQGFEAEDLAAQLKQRSRT